MRRARPAVLTVVGALALAGTTALLPVADAMGSTTAPPPVRSLAAGSVTASTIALRWTNPSRSAVATVVRMSRGTTAPRTRTSGLAVATVNAPGHSVLARRLAPETTYTFALFSTTGHARYSAAAVVRAVTAPLPVTRVHTSSTETSATVAWTNPATSTFSSIRVRYARGTVAPVSPNSGTAAALTSAKAARVTVARLAPGTSYAFGIWVRDAHGHYSVRTAARVVTIALPGAVSMVTATVRAPSIVLGWTNPTTASFTGVRICRADDRQSTAADPATCTVVAELGKVRSWSDATVVVSTTYTYSIFAHDAFGHFAPAMSLIATGPPPAPTGVAVRAYNSTTALLTWTAAPGFVDIQICRVPAGASGSPDNCSGSLFGSSTRQYADRTALPGRSYDYSVFTRDGAGTFSVPVSVRVTMPTPAGATVEGTVTAAAAPTGVEGVLVQLIAPDGRRVRDTDGDNLPDSDVLATTRTNTDGTYVFTAGVTNTDGIPPSNVGAHVCFNTIGTVTSRGQTGYASQCRSGTVWDTDDQHPVGTVVPLEAGVIDTVDATLTPGATVQGNVLTSPRLSSLGIEVDVYSTTNAEQTSAFASADGGFHFTGLNPGTYNVCFGSEFTSAIHSGVAPQCFHGATVGSATAPTTITLAAGDVRTVTDTVGLGGAIQGVVDDAANSDAASNAVGDADVYVFTRAGELVGYSPSFANGVYTIGGLPTGQPLVVCVDTRYATGSPLGYLAECTGSVPWNGTDVPPPSATTTTVAAAQWTHVGFDLAEAGAITGRLTNPTNGFGVGGVDVVAFSSTDDAHGRPLVWEGLSDSSGNYSVRGLPAGDYRVCFDATGTSGRSIPDPGYVSQCNGVPTWDGRTPAGTAVPVALGSATTVDSALSRAGAITGVARGGPDARLTDVTVAAVTDDGTVFTSDRSNSDGSYALLNLPAGTYHLCWSGARSVDPSAPTGYTSGCTGSMTPWGGGAAPGDAAAVTVDTGQNTVEDPTLTPASGASPLRIGAAAPNHPAITDRHTVPALTITAVQRLKSRPAGG